MSALTVPAGDTRLHVQDNPGGAPSLVLINGAGTWPGSGANRSMVACLSLPFRGGFW
jgi:hypothetical protein